VYYYQFLTVVAFQILTHENIDVAIFEVGIGGEYDTTNIIP
jgi:folylpolyglutamate synthase